MTPGNNANHSPCGAVGRSTLTQYPSTLPWREGEKTLAPMVDTPGCCPSRLCVWGGERRGERGGPRPSFPQLLGSWWLGYQLTLPRNCLWSEKLLPLPRIILYPKPVPVGTQGPTALASEGQASPLGASSAPGPVSVDLALAAL